jgi:predicted permease
MMSLLHDVRYAARQLLRTPGFTAAGIVTLGLGIGANTAFFAAVNAVVFRPMRTVQLDRVYQPTFKASHSVHFSERMPLAPFRLLEARLPPAIEAVDAQYSGVRDVLVHIPGRAERAYALGITAGHTAVFGLHAQLGRFVSNDEDHGRVRAAVISDRLWREWFNGARGITEHGIIRMNGDAFQIVGVAPAGYRGPGHFVGTNIDLWVPLSYFDATLRKGSVPLVYLKLRSGASVEEATAQTAAVVEGADLPGWVRREPYRLSLHRAVQYSPYRTQGIALLWLSAFVLLAACANLANMLYVRGVHRSAEMAVRQSLGATSRRIFQLLLVESALIGLCATALGLAIALAATRMFAAAFPLFRDRAARVTLDLSPDYFVFAYAFGAGAAAALLVGTTSAWRSSRIPPQRAMAVGDAVTSVTRTRRRTRLGLVALQVAAAVVLLMAAGAFFQQFRATFEQGVTFDTKPLAAARVDLARHGYHQQSTQGFLRRLLAEVRALPGIEQASVADGIPAGGYLGGFEVTFVAERTDLPPTRYVTTSHPKANGTLHAVSPRFLQTLGLELLQGRDFQEADRDGGELVAIVSRSMAARLWPNADPLGRRLMLGNEGHWRTVVGVAADPATVPRNQPIKEVSRARMVLVPAEQRYPVDVRRPVEPREMLIVIRAADARGQLDALRAAVRRLDENVALFDAATLDESMLAWYAPLRAARVLMGTLAGIALAIATLGVYSVVSFLVARRSREFGIRMALGARRRQVLKMVMDEAVHLLLVGLFAGVFVTALGERVLQARRYGLQPNELSTWAAVLVLMITVGLAAAFIPARRAAGIDPSAALRHL